MCMSLGTWWDLSKLIIKSANLAKGRPGRPSGSMNARSINVSWSLSLLMANGLELIKINEDYFHCNK